MEFVMKGACKVREIFRWIKRRMRQFLRLRPKAVELLPTPSLPPPPSPPPSLPYPDNMAEEEEEVAQPVTDKVVEAHSHGEQNVQHEPMLVLLSLSNHGSNPLYTAFALSLAFICRFVISNSPRAARVLEHSAIFFAVTAFFLAITMTFPICLKCLSSPIYALCLLFSLACFNTS
ncbi:hypothetical protein PVL29_022268 [Vitis rotundifolia]|uniref:Uncharacterized protein n=1 Tax=Vitis rotundifolia TaxID=103349 RepID=A0AA38YV51_VITRO|nr:hypothetical protein PVL29_022268 [Vitis rotundifolia]